MNPDPQSPKPDDPERREISALLGLVGSLGIRVCGGIFLFFLAGYYLDRQVGAEGVLVLLGLVLGIAFSMYHGYRLIMDHLNRFAKTRSNAHDDCREEDRTDA